MGFKHITPEAAEEARKRYESGESIQAIAEDLGYSKHGLRSRIKRDGAKIRPRGGKPSHLRRQVRSYFSSKAREPKQTMIEIPMATTPKKVAVIICDPSSVAEVVGSLWK